MYEHENELKQKIDCQNIDVSLRNAYDSYSPNTTVDKEIPNDDQMIHEKYNKMPSRVAAAATPAKSFLNFMRNPLFLIVIDFLAIAEAADPQQGLRDPQILIVFSGGKPSLPPSVRLRRPAPLSERSQNHLKFLEIRPADAYATPCSPQQPTGPSGPRHRRTPSSHDQSCHRSAADWR